MSDLLEVFLLSMTPLGELRLAIPIGIAVYKLNVFLVFFISIIGNLVPAFLLLIFLKKVSIYLSGKSLFFKKIFIWWEDNAKKKHLSKIQQYGIFWLALFVAVPLPMTGAWTGALLATLMNFPLKKSLLAILAGITGAGLIVTSLVILGINIEKYLGWQILIEILSITIFVWIIYYYKIKMFKNG